MPAGSPWARLGLVTRCGPSVDNSGYVAHYYELAKLQGPATDTAVPLCEWEKPHPMAHTGRQLTFQMSPWVPCPGCKTALAERIAKLDAFEGNPS